MFGPAHSTGNPIESISMGAIIISYMVIFVGILLLGSFIKFIVNYAVEGNGISVVNRILGAIFGLLRGTVIVLLAMFFVGLTTFATRPLWKDSQMVAVFKPVVKWVSRLATPYLAVLEAKMKKTTQDLNNQELNDVIKTKTVRTTNTVVPTPTPAMVIVPAVRTPDGPAPAPAITPAPPAVKPAS
jgi:uncharacterized membrane protein required for colicin V production